MVNVELLHENITRHLREQDQESNWNVPVVRVFVSDVM